MGRQGNPQKENKVALELVAADTRHNVEVSGPQPLASRVPRSRVLVVEDDKDLRTLIADELRRDRFEVLACADGHEAVQRREWTQAIAGDPWSLDVVVADLYLGDVNGLTLLQRIADSNADIPVVLVSAFGDVSSRLRAEKLGAAAFLDKPLAMLVLRRLLRQLAWERRRRIRTRSYRTRRQRTRRDLGG
jgi:DNA-binding NtrC family response regulator